MCKDTTIKELLPVYQKQALDGTEMLMVENHLASCEDCRDELSLLRMMAGEAVPDPGEAFWAAMPGRVYQAVQKQKAATRSFGLSWLVDHMTLPRPVWVPAVVGTVLLISWLIIRPMQKVPEMPSLQGSDFAEEFMPAEQVNVGELDHDELATIDTWAGTELATIAHETEQVLGNGQDNDVYEELPELNKREAEQLMQKIDQRMKEG
jgi:Putative zinc-finger